MESCGQSVSAAQDSVLCSSAAIWLISCAYLKAMRSSILFGASSGFSFSTSNPYACVVQGKGDTDEFVETLNAAFLPPRISVLVAQPTASGLSMNTSSATWQLNTEDGLPKP